MHLHTRSSPWSASRRRSTAPSVPPDRVMILPDNKTVGLIYTFQYSLLRPLVAFTFQTLLQLINYPSRALPTQDMNKDMLLSIFRLVVNQRRFFNDQLTNLEFFHPSIQNAVITAQVTPATALPFWTNATDMRTFRFSKLTFQKQKPVICT